LEVTDAKAQIEAFEKSLDTYRLDVGHYPMTEDGLNALLAAPSADADRWSGPYLKKMYRSILGIMLTNIERLAAKANTKLSPWARMGSQEV